MVYQSLKDRCVVCGKRGVDLHHIKTRKAGGTDCSFNMIPLCRKHHRECHDIGMKIFSARYQLVRFWLLENNWKIDEFMGRWVHVDPELGWDD